MRRRPRQGDPNLLKFGNFIRKLRQQRGLYLEHVATGTGFSLVHISEVERGIRTPSDDLISALAKFFKEPEEKLFFLAGRVPPSFTEEVLEHESLQRLIIQISQNRNLSEEKKRERYQMLINEFLKNLPNES